MTQRQRTNNPSGPIAATKLLQTLKKSENDDNYIEFEEKSDSCSTD